MIAPVPIVIPVIIAQNARYDRADIGPSTVGTNGNTLSPVAYVVRDQVIHQIDDVLQSFPSVVVPAGLVPHFESEFLDMPEIVDHGLYM